MRNIVNIEPLDQMLEEFLRKYQETGLSFVNDEKLRAYVFGNVRNYALRKAKIKTDYFFYFRSKSFSEREIFKKSSGPYHMLDLQDLYFRVQSVLDFVCYSGYGHKKPLTTLDFEIAEKKHIHWIKNLHKIEKTNEGKLKLIKTFDNNFKIVLLEDKIAYEREGFLMKNCVSSYFAFKRNIYSLRSEKNKPLVTMEVENDVIVQYLKAGNQKISKDLIPYLNDFAIDKKLKFKKVSIPPPTSKRVAVGAVGFILSGLLSVSLRLYMIHVEDDVPSYFPYLIGGSIFLWMSFFVAVVGFVGSSSVYKPSILSDRL